MEEKKKKEKNVWGWKTCEEVKVEALQKEVIKEFLKTNKVQAQLSDERLKHSLNVLLETS